MEDGQCSCKEADSPMNAAKISSYMDRPTIKKKQIYKSLNYRGLSVIENVTHLIDVFF